MEHHRRAQRGLTRWSEVEKERSAMRLRIALKRESVAMRLRITIGRGDSRDALAHRNEKGEVLDALAHRQGWSSGWRRPMMF